MNEWAIISDLHIGVHRSDPKYLQWALDYAGFLVDKMKERKTRRLFILGDVFHNRKEVSTIAIETARKFFGILRENEISVDVIPGNHDCYYDANTNATSLALLSGWSNVYVHYSPFDIVYGPEGAQKFGVMVPWGSDLEQLKGKDYKFVMGHFEITSFNMTSSQVCDNGISSDVVFGVAPLVFSGHFHLRCDRKYKNGKRIIYVGSPYELDWGDYGSTKGIYFYEPNSGEIDFVENDFSPKHVRLQYDPSVVNDKEKLNEFKDQLKSVNGNIVKLVSDDSAHLKQKDLQKIIEIVTRLTPGEFTCDLKSSSDEDNKVEFEISNNLDPKDALIAYIDATCKEHLDEIKTVIMNLFNQTRKG